MCGRYDISAAEDMIEVKAILEEINKKFSNTALHASMKTGEIFPTDTVPVIVGDGQTIHTVLMQWGFPNWNRPGVVINARAETAAEKNMFREALELNRCIVPSTGFYEWSHTPSGKAKDKFLVRLPAAKMLYMAGIYRTFKDDKGKNYNAFVICTTKASDTISVIHDRMPIILTESQRSAWLGSYGAAREILGSPHNDVFELTPTQQKEVAKEGDQFSFL